MDIKKSLSKIFGGREHCNLPVLLGNWTLEDNSPYGFVIKNTKQKEEWHFDCTSNGWITGLNKTNKVNPIAICLNTKGFMGYAPVLMDKDSIATRRKQQQEAIEKAVKRCGKIS